MNKESASGNETIQRNNFYYPSHFTQKQVKESNFYKRAAQISFIQRHRMQIEILNNHENSMSHY